MPLISGNEFIWGSRTYSMGIINVTPDSFSNDGILNNIKKIQTKAKPEVKEEKVSDKKTKTVSPKTLKDTVKKTAVKKPAAKKTTKKA